MSDNVLVIMTDQQALSTLGCYGATPCPSPNVDALAARGTRFTNHYTCTSLCTPARVSLMTGLYPHTHGEILNTEFMVSMLHRGDIDKQYTTVLEDFADRTYRTFYHGKWHAGWNVTPRDLGADGVAPPGYGDVWTLPEYDQWLEDKGLTKPEKVIEFYALDNAPEGHGDASGYLRGDPEATPEAFLTDLACTSLEEAARRLEKNDTPFLGMVCYWGPHATYLPAEPFASMVDPATLDPWPSFDDDLSGRPAQQKWIRDTVFRNAARADWSTWSQVVARYYGYAAMVDHFVGRVVDKLHQLDLAKNTWIVFTTDHGDTCGVHGGWFDKGPAMYDETYHIPLVIVPPTCHHMPPRTVDCLTSIVDLYPTLLEMADATRDEIAEHPNGFHGQSLLPLVEHGTCDRWREHLMAEFHGHRYLYSQRMLRWKQYKVVVNAGDIGELYDLAADPHELTNLIDDPSMQEVVREMGRRLREEMQRTGDDPGPQWQMLVEANNPDAAL